MTSRDVARRVLERVTRGDAWVNLALDGELKRSGLAQRDRALATELVYGVVRHQPRLDRALASVTNLSRTPNRTKLALRVAAYQILFLRVPAYAAVDDAVNAIRFSAGNKVAGFANAVLRKLAAQGEPALPEEPRARAEVEHSMPGWILDELARVLPDGDSLGDVAAGFGTVPRLAIRTNVRRGSRDELLDVLRAEGLTAESAAGSVAGIFVDGLGDPSSSPSFRAGLWTVQDIGAQRVAELCEPGAGKILDACAGVGGKSTHLAELTDDKSHIDAVDRSSTKLQLANETAARLGLRSVHTVTADLLSPSPGTLADQYDHVVLDAPCSGLGVLRRHPEAKWRLAVDDVARMATLQASLLDSLAPRVAPGGVLLYSVCTFTHAEGPGQITAFIARHPQFVLEQSEQTFPHRNEADAFFLARLRRQIA